MLGNWLKLERPHGRPRALDVMLVAVAVLSAWNLYSSRPSPSPAPSSRFILRGSALGHLPIAWDKSQDTIAVLVRTDCPACNSDAPFYKDLSRLRDNSRTRLVIAGQESVTAIEGWLRLNDIQVDEVVSLPDPIDAGFVITPTVLRTDAKGLVTDILLGAASPSKRRGFIDILSASTTAVPVGVSVSQVSEVNGADFALLRSRGTHRLVDARPESDLTGRSADAALIAPLEHLAARSEELRKTDPVLLDCRDQPVLRCRLVAVALVQHGLPQVLLRVGS